MLSLVELLPELVPEPLVVPEPVPEPDPLTEPEPVPDPVPLVVPERVDDEEPSEHPYAPRPRVKDKTAAVNRYLWFFIDPPFMPPTVTLRVSAGNRYAILLNFVSVQDLIWNVLVMYQVGNAVVWFCVSIETATLQACSRRSRKSECEERERTALHFWEILSEISWVVGDHLVSDEFQ